MLFSWLKAYLPRSLYGRAALILILPVLTLQLAVSIAFIQRHYDRVTKQMTSAVSTEMDFVFQHVNDAETVSEARLAIADFAAPLALDITIPSAPDVAADRRLWWDFAGPIVFAALRSGDQVIPVIDLTDEAGVVLWTHTKHGVAKVSFDRDRVSASNPHQLLVLTVVLGFLMTLISFLFLRNQLRPIKRMSFAATAFGKGRVVPFRPTGAVEVRAAGNAFLDMRNRIERHMEQRTRMLSGVSHDLRTPLTRLKLGLSLIDPDDAAPLQRDVEDMEHLLDGFLDFARGGAEDEMETCDPIALVESIVADAKRGGHPVVFGDLVGSGAAKLRTRAIVRAVENLISNANQHADKIKVSAEVLEKSVVISVEDNGKGIPEALREEAVKPFSRLDAARNQDRGSGFGLGLSIVLDVARSHGGMLRLGDSETLGGLRADLVLAR